MFTYTLLAWHNFSSSIESYNFVNKFNVIIVYSSPLIKKDNVKPFPSSVMPNYKSPDTFSFQICDSLFCGDFKFQLQYYPNREKS